jgi:hypothetical protein
VGAALVQLVSTPAGATLFGLLLIVPFVAGAILICAIFWPRIESTRGQTFDENGRCTCRQVKDAKAETREMYRQERLLRSLRVHNTVTGVHEQGIGR